MSAAYPYEVKRLPDGEVYARSLRMLERVGALAVTGALEVGGEGAVQWLHGDFETGALENLRTTQGVEECLDIERVRWYQMIDDRAVAPDGTPMVDIIERGYQKACETSEHDERMRVQAHRDEGDLVIAKKADALQPGQLLVTVSLPPLEGLASDPKFWNDLGYRDLVYIQTYHKIESGDAMVAGSFSVGRCDTAAWRRVLEGIGITVPADASADDFIRSFRVFNVSPAEAQNFGQQVRERYYHEVGEHYRRQSVTEYLEVQKGVVNQYFDRYMLPLAEAVYTGRNSPILQQFAHAILDTPAASRFSPEVAREVVRVANGSAFPRTAGAVMENLIRYALVERLREGLLAVVKGAELRSVQINLAQDVPYEILHQQLANDVASGVQAGRSYGGCASLVLNSGSLGEPATNPQEAYGGRGVSSEGESGKKKWMNCPYCGHKQYGDPCAAELKCSNHHCGAHVKNGVVLSKGNGGKSKQPSQKAISLADVLMTKRQKAEKKKLGSVALAA